MNLMVRFDPTLAGESHHGGVGQSTCV